MTAILGFVQDGITYMAGERGNSDEITIGTSLTPKVMNIGPYTYGYAGITGLGQSIAHNFLFTHPNDNKDIYQYLLTHTIPALRRYVNTLDFKIDEENNADILLGYKGRLFEISTYDFQCVEYGVSAIGSGRDLCLGSYHALEYNPDPIYIATTSIRAAIRFSTSCAGKIDIVYS